MGLNYPVELVSLFGQMDLPQFKDKLHEFERIVERMADPQQEQRRSDPRPTSDSLFREAFGLNRRKE